MGLLGMKVLPAANSSLMRSLLPAGEVMVSECVVDEAPGRTWHHQRVGPFRTIGGYNFVQMGWRNAGGLDVDKMPAAILGHRITVVDTQGTQLSLPPIHHHHCHVAPGLGYSFESTFQTQNACLLDGTACPDYSAIIFHHGDYECPAASGGVSCFTERYESHPRVTSEPLSLNAELNDVRPLGSSPITWYFEVSLLLQTRAPTDRPTASARGDDARDGAHDGVHDGAEPMSVHQVINPGLKELDKQAGLLTLVHCPSSLDSFFYYTGRMPFSGTFLPRLVRFHAHAVALQEALLLDLEPAALGLTEALFRPPIAWKAVLTSAAGLADNVALRARTLARAHASGGRLLCSAVSRVDVVDGKAYDRQPLIRCSAWRFARGDAWTTLALNGQHSRAFYDDPLTIEHLDGDQYYRHPAHGEGIESMEGMAQSEHDDPFDFRQHVQWHLSYTADDRQSHWTFATHSQTPGASEPRNNRVTLVRLILHKGTFQAGVDPLERTRVALFVTGRVCGRYPIRAMVLAIAMCAVPFWLCLRRRLAAALFVLAAEAHTAVFATYLVLPPVLLPNPHDAALMLEHEEERTRALVQLTAVGLGLLGLASMPLLWRRASRTDDAAAPAPSAQSSRLIPRVSMALLFLCGVIDMNDRMTLSLYAHVVQEEAHLSDAQLTIVISSVTSVASLLVTLPMGRAADKLPGAPLLASLLALLAVCELLNFTSLTSAFAPLAALRSVASIVDVSVPAILVPITYRISSPSELPLALSLVATSYAVGAAFANVAAPAIGGAVAWRPALAWLVAAPAVVVALLLLLLLPNTSKHASAAAMPVSMRAVGRLLHRLGATLPALSFLYQLELCQLVWYPVYFSRYGGRSVGEIGALMSTMLMLQSVGSLCGASLVSCLGRSPRAYLGTCILSALVSGALFSSLLLVDAASSTATAIAIALSFSLGLRSGPSYAIVSLRAGADTGLATAFTVVGNNLFSLFAGPTLVGLLSHWWGGGEGLRHGLQLVVATCAGIAAALWTWSFVFAGDASAPHEDNARGESESKKVDGSGRQGALML